MRYYKDQFINTHSFEPKPVIFLAFANDRVNDSKYLRNLPYEQREIRKILENAKQAGLCDIIERSNCTIDDILDVFQDKSYKDRIAIFHYGGHADCYKLLLESSTGARSYAFKEGLVSFLSRQKSLKLIFLNGCSTEQHALELKAAIPIVIGTFQEISDKVAAQLAIRFYHGIANGHSLERSWREAEDEIKTINDTSNFNSMYRWEIQEKKMDRFPWHFFLKGGAENVKEWNLPDAVNDPLFGIPGIPSHYCMPENPFRFLQRFEEKYARVFFGRGQYIRALYNRLMDPGAPPIILLYGQSGVGKSSLLEAGLIPRLKETHEVVYAVKDRQKGLLGTLEECLRQPGDSHHSSFSIQHSISISRPLVIILDQVEEIFTCPNPGIANELNDFLGKLLPIFDSSYKGPKIKFILGYRKEYHPEIDTHLGNFQLPCSYLFLEPLCRREIIETITGISLSPVLKQRYHNLEIEPELPGIIADNLLEDKNSPVAPVLQILLTKMWMMAIKENSYQSVFSVKNYQLLRKQGLAMEDFLQQQMAELKNSNPGVVNSGLALDLLKFHTTSLGTACSRNIDEIRQTYKQNWEMMGELVKQLKHLYLLTDTRAHENETSLVHDILAPVIIKEYNDSDKPGQRAARILAAKIEDFKKDISDTWLNEADLQVIYQGKEGMRALVQIEEELLEKSRIKKTQREKQIKRFKIIRLVLMILVVAAGLIAGWQWQLASNRAR
ncbi:MAG TPA: hypothetical protein VK469_17550, partial [Candidatus Kapabacteria bacterium]|nr:hypothetical protein [Candidatus Kapabacteria bacterium]